jgi:hypothetical protein
MAQAELLGRHTHTTSNNVRVNIWRRGDSYLARGSYCKSRFGETLGDNQKAAEDRLVQLLYEIGQGTYILPKDRRDRPLARPTIERLTVRQLCDAFLLDKRQTRGERTADDYRTRLAPLIEFAELERSRKRWPSVADVNRDFALEFRTFLAARLVNRNGRPAARERPISPRQIYNVLDCARTAFAWAKNVQVAKLLSSFVNPFTVDIVGERPRKDPLRRQPFRLGERIQLVANMDEWQLPHMALSMTLPLRPEDCAALLIGDVDFENGWLSFATRFGGRDFNKGRVSFVVPYPDALMPFLRFLKGDRADGPLLRARTIFEGRRRAGRNVATGRDVAWHIDDAFRKASSRDLKTSHDQKRLVRRTIREMGGVLDGELAEEFGRVLRKAGLEATGRFYDLRGAISTEMERAGVSHLVQRYVTGHTTGDILFEYASIDPNKEMKKYFATVEPLLEAMLERARQLGLKLPKLNFAASPYRQVSRYVNFGNSTDRRA